MAVPARPVDCVDQPLKIPFIDLDPQLRYRIRVVNTGYENTESQTIFDSLFPELLLG